MRLQRTWLAVSPSKRTVMLAATPEHFTLPPLSPEAGDQLVIELGAQDAFNPADLWVAISRAVSR